MAHFFNPFRPYDEHYENGRGTSLALKGELKIGLWTGDADLMRQLVVKPSKLDVASIRDSAVPFADLPDVRYFTVTGNRDGAIKIEAKRGEGGPVWAWMPLAVGSGSTVDTRTVLNLGGGIILLTCPELILNNFVNGVTAGAKSRLPSDILLHLETTIEADPVGFQDGYARGCLGGLLTGLKNLVKAVIDMFGLAIAFSPPVLMWKVQQEAFLLLTSAAQRELRKRQLAAAKAIAGVTADTIADITRHPNDYLLFSSDAGVALGQFAGEWVTKDFLQKSAPQIGEIIGSVVGQVVFEIIIQLLLMAFTEGAGNVARAGMAIDEGAEAARAGIALGHGAQGGTRIAGLAQKLKAIAMRIPGLQKFIRILGAEATGAKAVLTAESLSRAEMVEHLNSIWSRNPILQRLSRACRLVKGEAQHREVIEILAQFERETGIGVQVVPEGTVQASRGAGNLASLRSQPGVLQIEEQVFRNTETLTTEVKHELSYHYAGGPAGVPRLGEGPVNALILLEGMIEKGGNATTVIP